MKGYRRLTPPPHGKLNFLPKPVTSGEKTSVPLPSSSDKFGELAAVLPPFVTTKETLIGSSIQSPVQPLSDVNRNHFCLMKSCQAPPSTLNVLSKSQRTKGHTNLRICPLRQAHKRVWTEFLMFKSKQLMSPCRSLLCFLSGLSSLDTITHTQSHKESHLCTCYVAAMVSDFTALGDRLTTERHFVFCFSEQMWQKN